MDPPPEAAIIRADQHEEEHAGHEVGLVDLAQEGLEPRSAALGKPREPIPADVLEGQQRRLIDLNNTMHAPCESVRHGQGG